MSKFANLKNSIVANENKYAVFNPHTLEPVVPHRNKIIGVFIDPAIKTCALRVAEHDISTGNVRTMLQTLLDFRCRENDFATPGTSCFNNSSLILSNYEDYFRNSHYIILEHQCKKANPNVVRMSQHLISFIMGVVRDTGLRPLIIEIDGRLKSSMLGLKRMPKPELKKTTTKIAVNILKERGEIELAEFLEKPGKKDDMGDTVCYEFLWWQILGKNKKELNFPKIKKSRLNIN
jgi:hypothetical protein